MKSQTVVFFVSVPFFQFDHKVDGLGIFYTLYTKKGFYVNNTDTPKLNKVSCNIRSGAYQRHIADLSQFHHIVADKTVSPFDQFQGSLAFSYAAFR